MDKASEVDVLWTGSYLRVLKKGRWEWADRVGTSGAVAIVAVTDDRQVVLTEQHRVPMGKNVIELPAGLAGDEPGRTEEALETAARRELLEETGFEASTWRFLTSGPPSAGLATEVVAFFLARGLRRTSQGGGQAHERIRVHLVPLPAVEEWLASQQENHGALVDPKIFAGLYFLK
jgi:ADP-ribose pyrophosphatase